MKTKEESENISVDQLSLAFTCRTCLNTDSRQLLIPIFEDHKASGKSPFDLFDQLLFLKLKISPNDGFPANICSSCMERLSAVNAFRTQCERAQEFLNRYFTEPPGEEAITKTDGDGEYTELEYLTEPASIERSDDPDRDRSAGAELEEDLYCSMCGKNYKRRVHLERHLQWHYEQGNTHSVSTTTTYGCLKCGKRFTKPESQSYHRISGKCISPEHPTCRYCYESFSSEQQLETHLLEFHPKDRPHACPLCKKTFQSVSNRNTHLLLHNEVTFKCELCQQTFKSKIYLNRHQKSVHAVGHHTCPQCGATFTSTAKYKYHLKSHDPEKKYKCSYCTKSFLQQHHLMNHERIHTGKRPYLCNVCGKDFKHEPSFKTHLKIHDGVRSHVCEICNKDFVQRSAYIQHMAKHQNIRAFQCEQCGKDFIQRAALAAHLRIHSGERPFQCATCNVAFCKAQQLKHHNFMVHNGPAVERRSLDQAVKAEANDAENTKMVSKERTSAPATRTTPYVCKLCNKSFKLPSSLKSHLKVHNEERKHVCKECGNTFKRAEHLRVHVNGVHLKRKPYSCEVCNKSFSQSGDRNVHMRRHMSEKPHQCSYCGKAFSLAKALRAHIRLHTGEKPFVCVICNMNFISYSALASHTQKHQEEGQVQSSNLVANIDTHQTTRLPVMSVALPVVVTTTNIGTNSSNA